MGQVAGECCNKVSRANPKSDVSDGVDFDSRMLLLLSTYLTQQLLGRRFRMAVAYIYYRADTMNVYIPTPTKA